MSPTFSEREEIIATLKSLVNIPAVTGHEDDIRKYIKQEISPYARTEEDQIGNLIAHSKGTGEGLKVMISVHMDEIGYVVRSIDARGFLYLYPLGGIPDTIGPGQWVLVHTERGPVPGTTGIHSPHLPVSDTPPLFVDVGAERKHQAMAMGIKVGDPVTINCNFQELSGERVMGRCLDNRIGCTVLLTVMKLLARSNHRVDLYGVFSSTEEHGMHPGIPSAQVHGARGAFVAAQKIKPHFAIILDTMIASDIPGLPESERLIRLGGGVSLRLVDDLSIMRPGIRKLARRVAEKNNIKLQEGISRSFTDASVIQLTGAAVCTLGIPLRYVHSPGQVASISDIESTIKMVKGIIDFIEVEPPEWLTGNGNI